LVSYILNVQTLTRKDIQAVCKYPQNKSGTPVFGDGPNKWLEG